MKKIELFQEIYGEKYVAQFKDFLGRYPSEKSNYKLDQTDSFLISYADSIISNKKAFNSLFELLDEYLENTIKNVHILPMYPFTSDDGFSVVDYEKIREDLGNWEDLEGYAKRYGLMYDFVINHISASSTWFKDYLKGKNNYFIEYDENFDTSQVVRPRASPLFSEIEGKKVWTTFSEDQIDLNFKEYKVFEEATRILISYCQKGARFIRLDAIGFMWKESATSCIHLENTHKIIKLWRLILDDLFSDKFLITETNVPHEENISYFGNSDEAHMVYNFALPPLVADAILTGKSNYITQWISQLEEKENCSYFNFLSSHDGIGLRPVENILAKENIQNIVNNTTKKLGKINYKSNVDGSQSPYECNINYYSLLKENDEFDYKRLLSAVFILNSLKGCPAIYIHTLLGSENDIKGMEESGINRRINREQLQKDKLELELSQETERKKILEGIKEQLKLRKENPAFSPYSSQKIENYTDSVIVINRKGGGQEVTCIVNISNQKIELTQKISGYSLLDYKNLEISELEAYQYMWIERK
ncbi:MAG: alpha-amylase family glycosyl hydrolase [Lactovum sp.]